MTTTACGVLDNIGSFGMWCIGQHWFISHVVYWTTLVHFACGVLDNIGSFRMWCIGQHWFISHVVYWTTLVHFACGVLDNIGSFGMWCIGQHWFISHVVYWTTLVHFACGVLDNIGSFRMWCIGQHWFISHVVYWTTLVHFACGVLDNIGSFRMWCIGQHWFFWHVVYWTTLVHFACGVLDNIGSFRMWCIGQHWFISHVVYWTTLVHFACGVLDNIVSFRMWCIGQHWFISHVVYWTTLVHFTCGVLDNIVSFRMWCIGQHWFISHVVYWTTLVHFACGVLDNIGSFRRMWCIGQHWFISHVVYWTTLVHFACGVLDNIGSFRMWCIGQHWFISSHVVYWTTLVHFACGVLDNIGSFRMWGVVLLEANFEAIPINQCAYDGGLFSGTHRCNRQSTECKYIPSSTLQWGSYLCVCKEGYSFPTPNAANKFFDGRSVERAYLEFVRNVSSDYSNELNCLPMSTTPASTTPLGGEGDPIVAFDFLVRGIPLGIQSFCMTVSLVIAIVILCFRKTKVMRTSIWALLEMLLLGAILLYATVVLQYFEPTTTTCLLLPWLREMGFAIVYGVLVLKIYRILAEFQSRKAHRVHVRDKDLLKYLAVIMIVVIAYMSAWTAVNMDHLRNNSTILERLYTKDRLAYTLCRAMWWDYVIEAGEFIFLCFGIYMCYCIRSAPTEYSEGRFITGAICYEAIVSTIFYILRHMWWYEMHPDHLFLMFFLRCQLTVTVVLLIILGPK
ncbi:G-protein coupled receptor 158, partial [Biomphalaria glabrata]